MTFELTIQICMASRIDHMNKVKGDKADVK